MQDVAKMMWFLTPKYKENASLRRRLQYHVLRQIGVSVGSSQRVRDFRPRNFFLCFQRALNGSEDSMIQFNKYKEVKHG